jgi:hypothetical protein
MTVCGLLDSMCRMSGCVRVGMAGVGTVAYRVVLADALAHHGPDFDYSACVPGGIQACFVDSGGRLRACDACCKPAFICVCDGYTVPMLSCPNLQRPLTSGRT